jgi:COMPASS component SWD1
MIHSLLSSSPPLSSCFLINTADRIIRVYDGREILTCGRDGEPEPMQKLQDLVNR